MKRIAKTAVVALAMALSLSLGAGVTADAAKKVKVSKLTVANQITGANLTKKSTVTIGKGKKVKVKAFVTVTPNTKKNQKVTVKTSNKKIVSVKANSKGVITLTASKKKTGTAKVTVASVKNQKKLTFKVKVMPGTVKNITVDKTSVEIKKGEDATVTATAVAANKKKKANTVLFWESLDPTVATVTQKGVITAVAPGTTKVVVKSTDGTNVSKTIDVKVTKTTLALGKKDVTATIVLSDAKKAADDLVKLQGLLGKKDTDKIQVTVNGQLKEKSFKEAIDYAKTNTKVEVTVTIKNDKAAALGLAGTLFTPASVKSVKVGDVTFTNIKADSFKIGDKTYTYSVDGKNVDVDGHVADVFKTLVKDEIITATEN
ncbi:MAG: hypothetical protein E7271_05525 [Lachnospiraceae bacterium]|jgi:hypothetical protein|nr:hypothetical protein [Lachnospiraceae bacterium]